MVDRQAAQQQTPRPSDLRQLAIRAFQDWRTATTSEHA